MDRSHRKDEGKDGSRCGVSCGRVDGDAEHGVAVVVDFDIRATCRQLV